MDIILVMINMIFIYFKKKYITKNNNKDIKYLSYLEINKMYHFVKKQCKYNFIIIFYIYKNIK